MHPFRDGAPCLLLIDTPPTFMGAHHASSIYYTETVCLDYPIPVLFRRLRLPSISLDSDRFSLLSQVKLFRVTDV